MVTFLIRGISLLAFVLTVVSPAWGQDPKGIGVVTALTGRADLTRAQAPRGVALRLRDALFVRDVVDTHEESLAQILLMDKSSVTVRELSRFEIREEGRPDGARRVLIDLAWGKIRVMVARPLMKPGDEVQIRTPNVFAGVRGTDGIFEVTRLPNGTTRTVVTGISGEFGMKLPRPRSLVAMADVVSDAGPGIHLAQVRMIPIRRGERLLVDAVRVVKSIVPPPQLQRLLRGFRLPIAARGVRPVHHPRSVNGEKTRDGGQPVSAGVAAIARNPLPRPLLGQWVILPGGHRMGRVGRRGPPPPGQIGPPPPGQTGPPPGQGKPKGKPPGKGKP